MTNYHIWHLRLRPFGMTAEDRKPFTISIAMKDNLGSEKRAVEFAKHNVHSPTWWENYGIADVTYGGKLWAIEDAEDGSSNES